MKNRRSHSLLRTALRIAALSAIASLAACGGGSSASSTPPPPPAPPAVAVALSPTAAQTLDQGQTLKLTATVSNDSSNKGVNWTVSGGGTLSGGTITGVTYNAPASVTSPLKVTVTATSLASSSATASLSITVNPPPAVTTTSLQAATVGTAYTATLAASGGSGTMTWALSQGSLPAGLALSAGGVIAGTPTAAGTFNFSVNVKDGAQTTSADAALTLTVNAAAPQPLAITTTSLAAAAAGTAYSTVLEATGGTTPYTWSLAAGSSLPAGLALSAAGVLSGTPTAAGTANFSVQVTDAASTPAVKTQALSLAISASNVNASELNGQYAFALADPSTAAQAALVASVTADGAGNITGGEYDLNGAASAQQAVAITGGSYTVGADGRGTLRFQDGNSHSYQFAIAVGSLSSGVATHGALIETDAKSLLAGQMWLQNAQAFSLSALSGPFAFGLEGANGTYSAAGSCTVAASGVVSSGLMDADNNGTAATAAAFTGAMGAVDAHGRATLTITASGGTTNLAFYAVSADQLLLFATSTSAAPAITGDAERQSGGSFTAASLHGNIVLASQASSDGTALYAELGLITMDGAGNAAALLDEDDGGTLILNESGAATYSITSAANGRFVLSAGNALSGYLISPNNFFLTNVSGGAGLLRGYAQSAGPFSAATANGTFVLSTIPAIAAPAAPPQGIAPYTIQSGEITFDGSGAIAGAQDSANSTGTASGTYSGTYTMASNGRGTTGDGSAVIYILSPNHFLVLSLGQTGDPNPVILDVRK